MKALTLTQPWAGLVASGVKLVENRSRQIAPRDLFGKRFAIHASRSVDRDVYARIEDIAPELAPVLPDFDPPSAPQWLRLSKVTSAVIGVATLDATINGEQDLVWHDLAPKQRRWFFGPIGYVLRDVRALARPVPCRGMLGFWTVLAEVERAVEDQLE